MRRGICGMLARVGSWMVLVLLAALLIAAVAVAPLRAHVRWASDGGAHQLTFTVRAPLGLWRHRWRLRRRSPAQRQVGGRPRLEAVLRGLERLWAPGPGGQPAPSGRARAFVLGVGHHLVVDRWRLELTLGTGDPFATACACGAAYAIVGAATGSVLARLASGSRPPEIRVRPDYAATRVRARADCIAHIRIGHVIFAALSALWAAR